MADRPPLILDFERGDCADCGSRRAEIPPLPVDVPSDIDLTARDFEGFRQLMLESLVVDNPDRERWSESDMEVALVELLAAALDRMSYAVDSIFTERFLETAQWPGSVVRLLTMIDGVSPAVAALRDILRKDEMERFGFAEGSGTDSSEAEKLYQVLSAHPQLIDLCKAAALAGVNRFEACLSLDDLRNKLEEVPVFAQIQVSHTAEGGVPFYEVSVLLVDGGLSLVNPVKDLDSAARQDFLAYFSDARDRLRSPDDSGLTAGIALENLTTADIEAASIRTVVYYLLSPLLPVTTRLRLVDGKTLGIYMRLCVDVDPDYFRSEVEIAVRQVLSAQPGGLFEQKRLGFGVCLLVSDIQEALMQLKGVAGVIISRLQIVGDPSSEAAGTGILRPLPNQALVLDPDIPGPETGYYVLRLSGGLVG